MSENPYASAGVSVEAGYQSVRLMRESVESTFTKGVVGGFGGFGGLFAPDFSGMKRPILVSGTDGVGTKQKIAFALDKHDTVGIDCVAMSVNDVLCAGAQPLFFLDYIACGRNDPARIAAIVSGVAAGCRTAGCALIGGETAEHPGMMPEDEYDLAGFCVGLVEEDKRVDGHTIRERDVLLGLKSSGVHSNGFSLIRRLFGDTPEALSLYSAELGRTLGEELLTPTRIYAAEIKALSSVLAIKGMAHITGGGFLENVPRMLPPGLTAVLDADAFPIPPIFDLIQAQGKLSAESMFNTFNMGIGMVVCVSARDADKAMAALGTQNAVMLGRVAVGDEPLTIR